MSESSEPAPQALFRARALEHRAGARAEGDVLRLPPSWTRWTYWLVLAVVAALFAFAVFGRVGRHASGPAVVRAEGLRSLGVGREGEVVRLHVTPGQQVDAGDLLLELDDAVERAEYRRILGEFETHLAARLEDPADAAAAAALAAVRPDLERARARLEERRLRSPQAGRVHELRTRVGRTVAPGQGLIVLETSDPSFVVHGLLPGSARALLEPPLEVRVELLGQARAWTRAQGGELSPAVVGPAEARRLLGPEVADGLDWTGPAVLLRVFLEAGAFDAEGRRLELHDGMPARVEVSLGSESVLTTLFPGLARQSEGRRSR